MDSGISTNHLACVHQEGSEIMLPELHVAPDPPGSMESSGATFGRFLGELDELRPRFRKET